VLDDNIIHLHFFFIGYQIKTGTNKPYSPYHTYITSNITYDYILNGVLPQTLIYKTNHNHTHQSSYKSISTPNTLTYITTHLSNYHKKFLQYCWPNALQNSQLLNSSDIMLFITLNPSERPSILDSIEMLQNTFKHQNLTLHIFDNPGYQEGAIAALKSASIYDYFTGYDWVTRLNPDVIIQNDTFMLDSIRNDPEVALLHVMCDNMRINTDFFMLKVSRVSKDIFLEEKGLKNAELELTIQLSNSLKEKELRKIPEVTAIYSCRVRGDPALPSSHLFPVIHYHDTEHFKFNNTCPAKFKEQDDIGTLNFSYQIKNNKPGMNKFSFFALCHNTKCWMTISYTCISFS